MRNLPLAISLFCALAGTSIGQTGTMQPSPAQKMAQTVIVQWPAGMISTIKSTGQWGYEEGVLLDGMTAEWHATADGADFAYIKAAVDKYIGADGSIKGYKAQGHTLDDIELGRAVMVVYRVTQDPKYAKAAKFLHDQLALQPRTASGGYWHKQIYPNQMWLDGAYMAEPFRAMYASTFLVQEDWDDIAKQLLLMADHMRDPKTGLLRHGWDESKQMPWADKSTGLSPEVWGRAMGWYCMALVDTLDWFPETNPQRTKLLAVLKTTLEDVARYQDGPSGLWWQVMSQGPEVSNVAGNGKLQAGSGRPGREGNYLEASASAMFTYALGKSARMGYIPQRYEHNAQKAWQGMQKQFVTQNPDGTLVLHGTVKVGGLGGSPYRSGDFNYYIHEQVGDQDAKGVGAFLLAGSEIQQAATEAAGQLLAERSVPLTALMDAWFNSQTRTDAFGGTHIFHYKWDTDSNEGDSFFGYAFQREGVHLAELPKEPTAADLQKTQIYVIVSPDNPSKNPNPHYMDKNSGDAIEAWVKAGGVLLLFSNDRDNTEFEHFNTLSDRFGIHFNPVLSHHVIEPDHTPGEVAIPEGTGIFGDGFRAYMKDTSTITASGPAKPLVTDKGDVMIATAKVGKGTVLAIVDPWFYNEYADGRKMAQYQGFRAAQDVARWAVRQVK